MKLASLEEYKKILPLFPEGCTIVEIGAPDGASEFVDAALGIKFEGGPFGQEYYFVLEFADHDEYVDFRKKRKLILKMIGHVVPFFVGAYHEQEDNNPGLQQKKNGQHPD